MSEQLKRRQRKCEECPYKGRVSALSNEELAHALSVPNQDFPCHMEDGFNGWAGGCAGISCRGHWEAAKMAQKRGLEPKGMEIPDDLLESTLPASKP